MKPDNSTEKLAQGIRELVESSFPKPCSNCGRLFVSAEQFLSETRDLPTTHDNLIDQVEAHEQSLVDVFRNCTCGSVLMTEFSERRNLTPKGRKRRATFARMLKILEKKGVSTELAKSELIKATQGKRSELLEKYLRLKGQ